MKIHPLIVAKINAMAADHTVKAARARSDAATGQATSPRVSSLLKRAREEQKLADDWDRVLQLISAAGE